MEPTNIALPRVLESNDMIINYFTDYTSSDGLHQIVEFDTKMTTATMHEARMSQVLKLILNDYCRLYKTPGFAKLAQPPNRWRVMFLVNNNKPDDGEQYYLAEQPRADDSGHEQDPPAPLAPPPQPFFFQQSSGRFEDDGDEQQEQYDDVEVRAENVRVEVSEQRVQQHMPPSPPAHLFQLKKSPPATSGRDERTRNCSGGSTGGGHALRTRKPTPKSIAAEKREQQIMFVRDMAVTVMQWQATFEAQNLRPPKPQEVKQQFNFGLPMYKKVMTRIRYVKRTAAPKQTNMQTATRSHKRHKSMPDLQSDMAAAATLAQMSVAMVNSNSNPARFLGRGEDSMAVIDEEEGN